VSENYLEAALRHFADSDHLAEISRWGNAAHLVGFAAECAVKHRLGSLHPTAKAPHGHFPDLVDTARKHLRARRDMALHKVLKYPNLMDGWDVSLRYEGDAVVDQTKYSLWRGHAARLFAAAGLRR
jgi:hypothetical protein